MYRLGRGGDEEPDDDESVSDASDDDEYGNIKEKRYVERRCCQEKERNG